MAASLAQPFDDSQPRNIKREFPALTHGAAQTLHYLDSAATSQKPTAVIAATNRCFENGQGPVHRGLYPLAESASAAYEEARQRIARFIGAPGADQVVFTRSATESINMVAWGWLRPRLRPQDQVWVSRMEHHANFLPWQRVCRETGAELRIIELKPDGTLDQDGAEGLFAEQTRMIALCQISNVLGVENPLQDICARAASTGIPVLVDAAQSVAHMPVNVAALGCDFLVFSAHKMYGPGGVGALFGKPERLEEMEPLLLGGGMVDVVEDSAAHWSPAPYRFEAGSPNLAGAIGFAAAADWLTAIGMNKVQAQLADLTQHAVEALIGIPGLNLIPGAEATRCSIISFDLAGIHPHDVAQIAAEYGVALRAGHHCCQPLLRQLGLTATVRASFGLYNDAADVTALINALHRTVSVFRA